MCLCMRKVNIQKDSLTNETLGKNNQKNYVRLIKEPEFKQPWSHTLVSITCKISTYILWPSQKWAQNILKINPISSILWGKNVNLSGGTKCFRTERKSIPRLVYCYLFAVHCESLGVGTSKNLMRRVQRKFFFA